MMRIKHSLPPIGIHMNIRNPIHEAGQSLVLIALLMVAMIAFLGLVIDGGEIYVTRRNAQDSADAAAFAGVRLLANRSSTVTKTTISNTIASFAQENGVATSNDVVASFIDQNGADICLFSQLNCNSIPASATGVRVTVTIQYKPSFINIVTGNGTIPMPAVAAAQSGGPTVESNLMPMVVPITSSMSITYNQVVVLQGDQVASGGFQWITFNLLPCQGNGDVADYLSGALSSGSVIADPTDSMMNPNMPQPSPWLCGSTGFDSSNAIKTALDNWLNPAIHPEGAFWIVPVIDVISSASGSNVQYHTVMFAEFQLLGYDFNGQSNPHGFRCPGQGNNKCIQGKFLKWSDSTQFKPGACNTNGLNVCGIGLSQ